METSNKNKENRSICIENKEIRGKSSVECIVKMDLKLGFLQDENRN